MYILDTDIFSLAYTTARPNMALRNRIAGATKGNIFFSIVTVKESCRGALGLVGRYNHDQDRRLLSAYELFEKVLRSIGALTILPFDNECYDIRLDEQRIPALNRRRHPEDSRIAATALRFDLTLVTRNEQDYQGIVGLRVENWLQVS